MMPLLLQFALTRDAGWAHYQWQSVLLRRLPTDIVLGSGHYSEQATAKVNQAPRVESGQYPIGTYRDRGSIRRRTHSLGMRSANGIDRPLHPRGQSARTTPQHTEKQPMDT